MLSPPDPGICHDEEENMLPFLYYRPGKGTIFPWKVNLLSSRHVKTILTELFL